MSGKPAPWRDTLECQGAVRCPGLLNDELLRALLLALRSGHQARYALRDPFEIIPPLRSVLRFAPLCASVRAVLGPDAFCVRALYLAKPLSANWGVPWHQDRTIAYRGTSEQASALGFSGQTKKRGVSYALAPQEILQRMLTVRLHLDDCPVQAGALRVLAGSHHAVHSPAKVSELLGCQPVLQCDAKAKDAWLMRPLVVHSSGRSQGKTPRRVLHLEFSTARLPAPLRWANRYALEV